MSVDILQTPIPPLKRLRSSSSTLTDSNISKCGEVFVTNSADKWAFYCSHCQLTTTDIGVFVCHIRLQHLQESATAQVTQQCDRPITIASSRQNVAVMTAPLPVTSIPMENLLSTGILSTEQIQSDIVKEEPTVSINQSNIDYEDICSKVTKVVDMSSLNEPESNNETMSSSAVINDKNTTGEEELDEESLALPQPKQELNENILKFEYENVETMVDNDDIEATEDSLTKIEDESRECLTMPSRRDQNSASSSKVKTAAVRISQPSKELLPHKCPICKLGFKFKKGLYYHKSKIHDKYLRTQLPHKCKLCDKSFKSWQGLKYHTNNHDDKRKVHKCTICPGIFNNMNSFVTHALSHENDTRFPCQVCGKFFDSNQKRVKHWKTHAKQKPFGCSICYRRFPRQQYLTHHLKSHNCYQCHFCPDKFTTKEKQHIPYVCPKCDQLPDIKQKVEHLRTLANKSMVFESNEED